ncbi:Hypothetical predicted protein [Octopus vulgaris]|uniref:Uncharacterized protein n=1 Tax=Octopus vulgaris TaxID=6645 RepID=A0AA36BRB8_OCTVU|nr:Hypothetical predicted protein [Octopus vulgaris]
MRGFLAVICTITSSVADPLLSLADAENAVSVLGVAVIGLSLVDFVVDGFVVAAAVAVAAAVIFVLQRWFRDELQHI